MEGMLTMPDWIAEICDGIEEWAMDVMGCAGGRVTKSGESGTYGLYARRCWEHSVGRVD